MRRNRKKVIRSENTATIKAENNKGWAIFDWVVVIIFVLIVLIGGISALIEPEQGTDIQDIHPPSKNAIILQLFNGTGDPTVLSPVTDSLRIMGIDIRSEVKNVHSIYPYTIILDRKGNRELMDSIATMLGLSDCRIVLQRNSDIFDATLVVGKDYKLALSNIFESEK
ncbi:hypothetical protein DRQ33_06845 [bacterium]|nr:MAG: hypothetical protein DRQ33_06845 [bacterium]